MNLSPARRAGLERARAVAIARDEFGIDVDDARVEAMPFGVAVRGADQVCVVVSSKNLGVLGGLLVWIDRQEPADVAVVVEHHAGIHARRAASLAPEITVWELVGTRVERATPSPIPDAAPLVGDVTGIIALIERSGAAAVLEDGIIRAEVAGLEVGRVVQGPDGPLLEVGVGRFDREAGALLHGGRSVEQALVDVVALVGEHRQNGAPSHAINRMGRERWLRELVRNDPGLVGVEAPELVDPIPPRLSLLESGPAAMIASRGQTRVLVACTVGVDLALVPELADLVMRHDAEQICVVLPARDHLDFLDVALARLGLGVEIVPIEPPWLD